MTKAAVVLVLALAASINARASVIYTFTYSALSGTITITEPTFLASSAVPYSISGSLTDGTTTWNFTQLILTQSGLGFCFDLGTAGTTAASCNFTGVLSGPSQGAIDTAYFNADGESVPVDPGTFSQPGAGFNGASNTGGFVGLTGTANLTVALGTASAPEPSSFALFATGLALWGLGFRKRLAKR